MARSRLRRLGNIGRVRCGVILVLVIGYLGDKEADVRMSERSISYYFFFIENEEGAENGKRTKQGCSHVRVNIGEEYM